MATILDKDGHEIADATLEIPVNGSTARLRVPRANGLLNYYFGRGGRKVLVDTPDGRVEGHLNTHWERFGRVWEIVLKMPTQANLGDDSLDSDTAESRTPVTHPG